MVNASPNIHDHLWSDEQCFRGVLAVRAHMVDLSQFPTAEAYALAEDPNFLPGRTIRTCGALLSAIFPITNQGDLTFGRAACDPQLLIFTFHASRMRDADRTATADTPLAKYVEALFRLRWTFAQFWRSLGYA